ncbi:MAG: hypothetical protein KIG84_01335 [Bacteroidales bacterium]|nr:hypothetical protein [Bacteroidales bacterium]
MYYKGDDMPMLHRYRISEFKDETFVLYLLTPDGIEVIEDVFAVDLTDLYTLANQYQKRCGGDVVIEHAFDVQIRRMRIGLDDPRYTVQLVELNDKESNAPLLKFKEVIDAYNQGSSLDVLVELSEYSAKISNTTH